MESENAISELDVRIVETPKEGLSAGQDAVEFVIRAEIPKELLIAGVTTAVAFALKKMGNYFSPAPHILIVFENGQKKQIWYKGKSNKTIVDELLAEIQDGEVVRVYFKS